MVGSEHSQDRRQAEVKGFLKEQFADGVANMLNIATGSSRIHLGATTKLLERYRAKVTARSATINKALARYRAAHTDGRREQMLAPSRPQPTQSATQGKGRSAQLMEAQQALERAITLRQTPYFTDAEALGRDWELVRASLHIAAEQYGRHPGRNPSGLDVPSGSPGSTEAGERG